MSRQRIQSGALALALGAACLASPALADTPGRYSMSPTDGGFVRLDTQTGAMALCTLKDAAWSCKEMPESADASRKRLDELEKENRELKDEVARLEHAAPADGQGVSKPFTIPDEKDVDKAFDYLETMIKKFRERAKRLEEQQDEKPSTPL